MSDNFQIIERAKPGKLWYVLVPLVFLAGAAIAFSIMIPRIMQIGDGLQQVIVPGEIEIELSKPGSYTIFHESHSTLDGEVFVLDNLPGMRVFLTDARTGQPVPLKATTTDLSYSFASRSGRGLLTFEITEPGPYRLKAVYRTGTPEPRTVFAVGQGFVGKLLTTIFVTLALLFAAVMAAVLTYYLIWRKRHPKERGDQFGDDLLAK